MSTTNLASPLARNLSRSIAESILFAALISAAAPATAFAQTASGAEDEIIVTAQRRSERLVDTPIAVTAFNSESIRDLQIHTASDLTGIVPNLTATDPGTSLQYNIRGQALIDVSDVNEAPVAVYFDNVYVAATAGQGNQLFDIDRIEVLRGPQGTLFGRNSSAGLIQFISARPTEELSGYASAQVGSNDQLILEGALSGAIMDGVRGRISLQQNTDDGYQKNLGSGGGRFGVTDTFSGRGQLEFDLSPDATLLLQAYGTRQRNVHPLYPYVGRLDSTGAECSPGDTLSYQCGSATGYHVGNPEPDVGYTEHSPGELPDDLDMYGGNAQLTWDIGSLTLTSITAYSHLERTLVDDADGSDVGIGNYGDFNYTERFDVTAHQASQEFRLAGGSGRRHWTIGAFYFEDTRDASLTVEEISSAAAPYDTIGAVETKSWAVFGQTDFPLTDTLTATIGVRYTDDDKTADIITCDQFSNCPTLYTGRFSTGGDNVSGRLGLEWRPFADALFYATASSGYKSGEFNITFLGGALNAAEPVGEENTYSFEIGSKTSLFDRSAQLNVALFYTVTEDKQAIATTSLTSTTLMNIGDVVSYGAEVEFSARPVDWLYTSLGIGLLDSTIDADDDVSIVRNYNRDLLALDGNDFINSPSFSINGLIRPTIYQGAAGTIDLQADFHWQTSVYLDVANSPYDKQDSYGNLNLRALWTTPDESFNASLFVENVTDEEWYSRASSIGGLDYRFSVWGSRPRTVGLQLGYNF